MQAIATGTATRTGAQPFHMLSIEEARERVVIKDGNRKPNEDGSVKLTVTVGKHTLPLDCIQAGTTRLDVSVAKANELGITIEDAIVGYTDSLKGEVNSGAFDEALLHAQELAKAQADKPRAERTVKPAVAVEETEGLDLDSLEVTEEA